MQITELRIAGFKSFVDPQDVPIHPGLTGIVGPNGCGKSNLLEALRWAMGASSAKAMRGGEMDDLIFSGSGARPARETAEVTLVLDNEDRSAPAEYNEADILEVQRKIKRGAGSSYKLNGRSVRAKDIQLLFADASTGANSPALVRQGQISELIGSKPQNRRRILEEAAGIGGLNARRHEAELKLNGAEANLERLSEVTAEVERQLNSLKRQASKARRYKALSEEIHGLSALVAHLNWLEARVKCQEAEENLDAAEKRVQELTVEDAEKERLRVETSDGLAPIREAESVAAAKLGQARIELAKLETERKNALERYQLLDAEAMRLVEDLEREQAAKQEADTSSQNSRNELNALPVLDEAKNSELEEQTRAELESARETLKAAEERADSLQSRLSEVRAASRATQETMESQSLRKEQLQTEISGLQSDIDGLEDAISLATQLKAAKDQESNAEMALHDAERGVESMERALAECRQKEEALWPKRDEADQKVRAIEAEIAGLMNILAQPETTAPPVVDRIKTEDGYERAVAAALGDDIEASTDRDAAMYWGGADSASQVLPVGATPLSELINAPAELEARLTQCGLVSADQGSTLMRQLKPGQRLVSKDGHLWRWDGFTRTPDAPVSAAVRLEQKARLAAAQSELKPLQARLDTAQSALDTSKQERLDAELALKETRQQVPVAQDTLNAARVALANAVQASERAAMKRDSTGSALARAQTDLAGVLQSLELVAAKSVQTSTVSELESDLARARDELSTARAAEIEARGRLTDITRGREQAIARREALERDVETWTQRAFAAGERISRLAQRRHAAISEAREAEAQPETMKAQIESFRSDVEVLEAERKQHADALAVKETAIREAEKAAKDASNAASKAREHSAGSRVKLENAKARVEECVVAAREDFQRAPEGLLTIAEAGLDQEKLETMGSGEAKTQLEELRRKRDGLGGVNQNAEEEASELEERLGAQVTEKNDLIAAIAKLREGVDALNEEGRNRLTSAFEQVNEHFKALFTALFRGGQAELKLVDADDPLKAGLEIFAQPPGKKLGTLNLMSGGEQALTATALIFAVFLSRPAPICVLDEVDAPLDDANVDRFCNMLNEMRNRTNTRFVVITHNPVTMSRMDRLFGVTMREKGVSKLVSVDLQAAEDLVAAE